MIDLENFANTIFTTNDIDRIEIMDPATMLQLDNISLLGNYDDEFARYMSEFLGSETYGFLSNKSYFKYEYAPLMKSTIGQLDRGATGYYILKIILKDSHSISNFSLILINDKRCLYLSRNLVLAISNFPCCYSTNISADSLISFDEDEKFLLFLFRSGRDTPYRRCADGKDDLLLLIDLSKLLYNLQGIVVVNLITGQKVIIK